MLVMDNSSYSNKVFDSTNIINNEHIYNTNFTECDFGELKLENVTFTNCKFYDCRMHSILFKDIGFFQCDFHKCVFEEGFLMDTEFDNCYCEKTEFINMVSIYDTKFVNSRIAWCRFCSNRTNDDSLVFKNSSILLSVFEDFNLSRTKFEACQIRSSRFTKTNFYKSEFYKCAISGTWFRNLSIDETIFYSTTLINCWMQHLKITEDVKFNKCSFADVEINHCEIPEQITHDIKISPIIKDMEKIEVKDSTLDPNNPSLAQSFINDQCMGTPRPRPACTDILNKQNFMWGSDKKYYPQNLVPVKSKRRAYLFVTEGIL